MDSFGEVIPDGLVAICSQVEDMAPLVATDVALVSGSR